MRRQAHEHVRWRGAFEVQKEQDRENKDEASLLEGKWVSGEPGMARAPKSRSLIAGGTPGRGCRVFIDIPFDHVEEPVIKDTRLDGFAADFHE